MMASLSPRERRLVAILILVAAVAFVWLAVIAPIAAGFAARADERQRLTRVYAGDARLIGSIARLRKLVEQQRRDRARFRIIAPNPTAASEALKARLSEIVGAVGGETRSVQDVEADPGWVRAWIEARLTQAQLVALVDRLQNQAPVLVLTTLSVSADRAASSAAADNLDVHIETMARHGPAQPN